MIEQVRLRDNTNAFVLPLQRTDKAKLAAEFDTLSPESQRRRFLGSVLHLNDMMLHRLVDDVDGIDHIALVLCAETSPDVYDPVALARIVRYMDVPDAADLAVTVKDKWQGRGVATVLLEVLMRKRPVGVERIVTDIFSDNRASLKMLHRLGHTTVKDLGSGGARSSSSWSPSSPWCQSHQRRRAMTPTTTRECVSHLPQSSPGSLRCCATRNTGMRCARATRSVHGSPEGRRGSTR